MRRPPPADLTRRIRRHYDLLAPFYSLLWGEHLHHGYWTDADDPAPPAAAQERLVDELYTLAGRPPRPRVLDVGCGYGGSLRWLARRTGATGDGITLSSVQRLAAALALRREPRARGMRVLRADAQLPWPTEAGAYDLVWCVECSEHLADRGHLAREAARVLRPGGLLCLAAWLASEDGSPTARGLRREVARGMLCYPFDTAAGYRWLLAEAGLESVTYRAITGNVARSWDLGIARRERPAVRAAARVLGGDTRRFAGSFEALRRAYAEGAMEYGLLVARTPPG